MSIKLDSFKANLSTLIAFMQANAITAFNASYEGAGDSGETTDITLVGPDDEAMLNIDALSAPLPYIHHFHAYRPETGRFESFIADEPKQLSVSAFLDAMVDDLIDHCGYRGYEINGGGSGFITVHPDGSVNLDHTYMVPETETHAFRLSDLSPESQSDSAATQNAAA